MRGAASLSVAGAVILAALAACSRDDPAPSASPSPSPAVPPGMDGGVGPAPGDAGFAEAGATYDWKLPPNFPRPKVPSDNPMSAAKVALGRRLFFDTRLSGNQMQSCGSCHDPARSFTDGRAAAVGSTGETHSRGAMSLANVGYMSGLAWANPLLLSLEQQAMVPMFGDNPVELGLTSFEQLTSRLEADAEYPALFAEAFPGATPAISVDHVVKAIASFERSLVSGGSPYDRFLAGDPNALTESQKRGRELFFSEDLECYHCHSGFLFTDSVASESSKFFELYFHNTGLYNIDGAGAYPPGNTGILEITEKPGDMGRFRVPSLRNVAVTAPYFHDGSAATLSDVLDHYAAGGRTIASGPYAGNGSLSPLKNELVRGFTISEQQRSDVIAFLESLTDETFLTASEHREPR